MNGKDDKSLDKVSLVLTTYNSAENIGTTLSSILGQDYPEIEIIVKDGGSSDETQSIVNQYINDGRGNIKLIVKPDTGIYDAMNQGYAYSTGDIIAFFNDRFVRKDADRKSTRLNSSH